MSRTSKTAINSITAIICSLISSILSFLLQAIFIRLLGLEYSGINTLFSSILNILNLAELGISNAVLFRLYKGVAENNTSDIEKYLSSYRRICYTVGTIVGVVGLCFVPFLSFFVKEEPAFSESLWSLYLIVLGTSVVSHFIDYRGILFIAKQERYINTVIGYFCIFLKHGLQILVLAVFKNIYLYLLVSLFTTILKGFMYRVVVNKRYGISWHSKERLTKSERRVMGKDVGSLAFYKLCRTLDANIDTFLISKFIAVATTAIYGSVMMLLSALHELLGAFNDGMIAGIGDLYAGKEHDRIYDVFKQSFHFTYLIYGISTAVLAPFLSAFAVWWIDYTLPDMCIYTILVNFFLYGMGMNIATFRNSMGLFSKGWKRPAVTAGVNLIASLFLIQRIGLLGALLGTTISYLTTLSWYDPYIVLKHGMGKKPYFYYFRYVVYFAFTAITAVIMLFVKKMLPEADTLFSLIWHGVVYLGCSSVVILAFGSFFPEQKMIVNRVRIIVKDLMKKYIH